MVNVDKVFVLHVKKGSEARAKHMESMLGGLGIDFEYMLDGDISDITPERRDRYFITDQIHSGTSCAMKHILVMERMVEQGIQRALILEDDAILRDDFVEKFNKSVEEADSRLEKGVPNFIFYEATFMWFIPRSQRVMGQMLYKPRGLQCLACYTINLEYAKAFLEHIKSNRCQGPIDEYIERLRQDNVLPQIYQCHPDLCIQGSHVGNTESLLGNHAQHKFMGYIRRRLTYILKKYIIYNFR